MSFMPATDAATLRKRVDEIQARLESLEAAVFDEPDELEPPETTRSETMPTATMPTGTTWPDQVMSSAIASLDDADAVAEPRATSAGRSPRSDAELKDLRKLQAAATADLRFEPLATEPQTSSFGLDLRDIEQRLAGRALALVGGTALILGAALFLSLAFSRGWITPQMQVLLGLSGGALALLVGAFLLGRGEQVVGHVLTAVGLAVISLSLFAATSLYALIEPALALAGVFLAASATTIVAIRNDSQVVAGLGLVAALVAPPIMGAEPDLITVAYVAVVLVGVATISLAKTWSWLPPIAFLLSVPQLAQWMSSGPDPALAVPVLLGYWMVMTAAAGGEAFRIARRELSLTSAPLFMAVGASTIGLAFMILTGDVQRAAFLLVLAALHASLTAVFVRRRGLLDPFGLLAAAYGTAMATAAVPLLLDASATSVVWVTEAAALAVLAGRRAHAPALMAAAVLYTLAAASIAYQALLLSPVGESMSPIIAAGTTQGVAVAFAFFAAAGMAQLLVVPVRPVQSLVAGLVGLVALPLTYLLLEGPMAVTAFMAIAVAATGTARWLSLLPERHIRWRLGPALRWLRQAGTEIEPLAPSLAWMAGILAIGLAVTETAVALAGHYRLPDVPFTDRAGLSGLALAAGFVAVGLVAEGRDAHRRCAFAAGLTIGIVSLTQFATPWFVVVWATLAIAAALMSTIDTSGKLSYRWMSCLSLLVLAVLAIIEAPPTRLVVSSGGVTPHALLVSNATIALGSLAVALGVVSAIGSDRWPTRLVRTLAALAGGVGLYLLSVGVVDVFAGEASELLSRQVERLDELAKEAQVALSVLWTAVGVIVLGLGLLSRRVELRLAGLVVLGLATVKVFLIDLAALDVAYRVITLIVLGLLLVVSAYAWSRMKPPGTAPLASGQERTQDLEDDDQRQVDDGDAGEEAQHRRPG